MAFFEGDDATKILVDNAIKNGSKVDISNCTTERTSLAKYTGIYYTTINAELGKTTNLKHQQQVFIQELRQELGRVPPQSDVLLFRGIRTKITNETEVADRSIMSKSRDMSVALRFGSGGTLMFLHYPNLSKHLYLGKISVIPTEEEVISYPGEVFRITARGREVIDNQLIDFIYAVYDKNMYGDIIRPVVHFRDCACLDNNLVVVKKKDSAQTYRSIMNPVDTGAIITSEDFYRLLKEPVEVLLFSLPVQIDVKYLRKGESKPFEGSVSSLLRDFALGKVLEIIEGEFPKLEWSGAASELIGSKTFAQEFFELGE